MLPSGAADWLARNGGLRRRPDGTPALDEDEEGQLESGHLLYRVLVFQSKRLGVSLGAKVPALGCGEDEACPPAVRLFNWKIIAELAAAFGYEIEPETLQLVADGDTAVLCELHEDVQGFFQRRAPARGDEPELVDGTGQPARPHGYGYAYQPSATPPPPAPARLGRDVARSSSVPPAAWEAAQEARGVPPPSPRGPSADVEVSGAAQPSRHSRFTKRHIDDIAALQRRRQELLLERKQQQADDEARRHRLAAHLRHDVDQKVERRRAAEKERARLLAAQNPPAPTPGRARRLSPLKFHASPHAAPLPALKKPPGAWAEDPGYKRHNFLMCQDLVTELVNEVTSGAAKTKLEANERRRAAQQKVLLDRRSANTGLYASRRPLPLRQETLEALKGAPKAAILMCFGIVSDVIASVFNGEAAARLRRRRDEVEKARRAAGGNKGILLDVEALRRSAEPDGSAAKRHKERVEAEKAAAEKSRRKEDRAQTKRRRANLLALQHALEEERKQEKAKAAAAAAAAEGFNASPAEPGNQPSGGVSTGEARRKAEAVRRGREKAELAAFHALKAARDAAAAPERAARAGIAAEEARLRAELAAAVTKQRLREWHGRREGRGAEKRRRSGSGGGGRGPRHAPQPARKPHARRPPADEPGGEAGAPEPELPKFSTVSNQPAKGAGDSEGERMLTSVEHAVYQKLCACRERPETLAEELDARAESYVSPHKLKVTIRGKKTTIYSPEGPSCCAEAAAHVRTLAKPLRGFAGVSAGLTLAARQQAADLAFHYHARREKAVEDSFGADGGSLTERAKRYGRVEKRCVQAVFQAASPVPPEASDKLFPASLPVTDFLASDGDPSRASRRHVFDAQLQVIGVGHATARFGKLPPAAGKPRQQAQQPPAFETVDVVVVVYSCGFHSKPVAALLESFAGGLERVAPGHATPAGAAAAPEFETILRFPSGSRVSVLTGTDEDPAFSRPSSGSCVARRRRSASAERAARRIQAASRGRAVRRRRPLLRAAGEPAEAELGARAVAQEREAAAASIQAAARGHLCRRALRGGGERSAGERPGDEPSLGF
ncbi:hypothetical protein DIPPA_08325 [Diplonema papillatum]|nr:hypothetical protein DIPPA_08325 [Diplonema papillatum]